MKYGTRNLLDLKVGQDRSIQVMFHLRIKDIQWFNENSERNTKEIIQLISKRILPEECKEEIETKGKPSALKRKPSTNGRNDGPFDTTCSSGTSKKKQKKTGNETKDNKASKNVKGAKTKTQQKLLQKQGKEQQKEVEKESNKREYISKLDTAFLFADHLQIVYKIENIGTSHSTTLNYVKPTKEEDEKITSSMSSSKSAPTKKTRRLSKFKCLKPLSKKVVIWCYPFDQSNSHELNIVNVGNCFPRTELIPISNLFHETNL